MAFSDQSALFTNGSLLTWQLMDQMADNDAYLDPFIESVPAFGAYHNTTQSIAGSTLAKLSFNTIEFNRQNCFASSRFTPTKAGWYLFLARAEIPTTTAYIKTALQLFKNGSQWKAMQSNAANTINRTIGDNAAVMAHANGTTDYFEAYMENNESVSYNVSGGQNLCYFAGHMILTRL